MPGTDIDGEPLDAFGSNYGEEIDIMGHGFCNLVPDISGAAGKNSGTAGNDKEFTTDEGTDDYDYRWYRRTSSACPQVAGAAALLLSATLSGDNEPTLTPAEVQGFLQFGATDLQYTRTDSTVPFTEVAGAGRDVYTGWGMLNVKAALDLALAPRFVVRADDGRHMMSIDQEGNMIVEGYLFENHAVWLPYVAMMGSAFQIRNSAGTIKLIIPETSTPYSSTGINGNHLWLAGYVYEEQTAQLAPSAGESEVVIKDSGGAVVARFDDAGNVYLKGRLFQGANPDPGA